MCTVILKWDPESQAPLLVGANRDEIAGRPSEPFAQRGNVLCPLDVRGGTWVGVNDRGMFVAVTNRDAPHKRGRNSRGLLTLMALSSISVTDVEAWMVKMDASLYNWFNLIVADRNQLLVFASNGFQIHRRPLRPGLHVVTGYGVDTWTIPRCHSIQEYLMKTSSRVEAFKRVLSLHGQGDCRSAVCIHDRNETHRTRSACVVKALPDWSFEVQETDEPPCQTRVWRNWKLNRA